MGDPGVESGTMSENPYQTPVDVEYIEGETSEGFEYIEDKSPDDELAPRGEGLPRRCLTGS